MIFFVGMLVGLWSSTFGLNFVLELVRRCTTVDTGSFAQWKHWCTTSMVWYLAIRLYLEATVLAVRRVGSGRILSPDNPRGLLRLVAGWELNAVFVIAVCVVA